MSMDEAERLNKYYEFDSSTTEVVAEVAEELRSFDDWPELLSSFRSNNSHAHLHEVTTTPSYGFPIKIIDIVPVETESTMIYHLPMGNSVDENMQARLITLSKVIPNTRIIASGNPAQPFVKGGKITSSDRARVSRGIFRDTIDPILHYVHSQKIDSASQVGYSYGADKAVSATSLSHSFDIEPTTIIPMEPVSIKQRTLKQLGLDFLSSNQQLKHYVESANLPAYQNARRINNQRTAGLGGYTLGLLRASNLAIANGIACGEFEQHLTSALRNNPETNGVLIWGSESELAVNAIMQSMHKQMQYDKKINNLLDPLIVSGGHHAMGDDIFLHSALIHQALSDSDMRRQELKES